MRKLVVIPPIRVKDRFDGQYSSTSSTYPWSLFFVIVVESLHDVLPKGLLAAILLLELPKFRPSTRAFRASERSKGPEHLYRVSLRLFDKPDDGRLLAVHLNASCRQFLDVIPGFYMRFRTIHLNVHTVVSEEFFAEYQVSVALLIIMRPL